MVAVVLCWNSVAVESYYIYSVLDADVFKLLKYLKKRNMSSPIVVLSRAICNMIMVFEKLNYVLTDPKVWHHADRQARIFLLSV